MPTVTFSLKTSQWEVLESAATPGESQNLAAKRILLDSLGGIAPVSAPDGVDYQNHRLDRLEEIVDLCNPADPNRIDRLEERLTLLEQRLSVLENRATPAPVSPTRLPAAQRRGA